MLKAICCGRFDELEKFDSIFALHWGGDSKPARSSIKFIFDKSPGKESKPGSLSIEGFGSDEEESKNEGKSVSGSNTIERLADVDFNKLPDSDRKKLEEMAQKLWKEIDMRITRKQAVHKSKGELNIRRIVRRNLKHGANNLELVRRRQIKEKRRLVVLLDVSASMDKYSFFFLRYLFALKKSMKNMEAFVFSFRLQRITDYVEAVSAAKRMREMSNNVRHWSSGTKIGPCLMAYNELYGRKLSSGSTVMIFSDGMDTAPPSIITKAMKRLSLQSRRIIWVNPMTGMAGYQPIQTAMAAAMPYINHFKAGHSFNSLLQLESLLSDV